MAGRKKETEPVPIRAVNTGAAKIDFGARFDIAPLSLGGNFACDARGLMWIEEGKVERIAPFSELKLVVARFNLQSVNEGPSKNWWRAHCAIFGLGTSKSKNKFFLHTQLKDCINTVTDYPTALLTRADVATAQFQSKLDIIKSLLTDFEFDADWLEEMEDEPKRKRARPTKDAALYSSSSNQNRSHTDSASNPLEDSISNSPAPKSITNKSSKGHCARGGRSALIDSRQIRLEADNPRVATFLRSLAGASLAPRIDRSLHVTRFFTQQNNQLLLDLSSSISPIEQLPESSNVSPSSSLACSLDWLKQQGQLYASRCAKSMHSAECLVYQKFIHLVEVTIWTCRMSQALGKALSVKEVYNILSISDVTYPTFSHWQNAGYTLLRLMYATSVHALSAVSVATMSTLIDRVLVEDRIKIENLLRDPHSSRVIPMSLRTLIATDVVGYHRYMLSTFRDGVEIGGRKFGVNLPEDDAFIRNLCMSNYPAHDHDLIPRTAMWSFNLSTQPSLPSTSPESEVFYISTNFDPDLEANRSVPQALKDDPVEWTRNARIQAEAGLRPKTVEEMAHLFQKNLEDGTRGENGYVWVPTTLVANRDILAYGKHGSQKSLIFFRGSCDTIPDNVKKLSLIRIKDSINLQDEQVDSATAGDERVFNAVHMGFWNKMGINGEGVDSELEPRQALADIVQSQPYNDRGAVVHADDRHPQHFYQCPNQDLNDAIWELTQPILIKLQAHLPDLMAKHEDLYSSLGPSYHLGSAPFCMTVINIQPATLGHRDTSDMIDSICVVVALGEFKGGGLCLHEPGGVVPLEHGHFVAIPSKRDVHFNLHFSGQRLSLVLTSDQSIKHWKDKRNGWVDLQRLGSPT